MQPTLELPASSPILPNPSLNDTEALEQTPALQILVTVVLALKDLPSCRSHKQGGLACSGRANGISRYAYQRTTSKTSMQVGDSEVKEK
jgi:hypothetical protein